MAEDYAEKIKNADETETVYKAFCCDKKLENNEKSANAELLKCSYFSERINAFWAGFEAALMLITGK